MGEGRRAADLVAICLLIVAGIEVRPNEVQRFGVALLDGRVVGEIDEGAGGIPLRIRARRMPHPAPVDVEELDRRQDRHLADELARCGVFLQIELLVEVLVAHHDGGGHVAVDLDLEVAIWKAPFPDAVVNEMIETGENAAGLHRRHDVGILGQIIGLIEHGVGAHDPRSRVLSVELQEIGLRCDHADRCQLRPVVVRIERPRELSAPVKGPTAFGEHFPCPCRDLVAERSHRCYRLGCSGRDIG